MPPANQQTNAANNASHRIGKPKNEATVAPSKVLAVCLGLLMMMICIINMLASHIVSDGIGNASSQTVKDVNRLSKDLFQNLGGRINRINAPTKKIEQQQLFQQNRDEKQEIMIGQDADNQDDGKNEIQHSIAGLSCDSFGGPSEEEASEMIFWSDIKSDSVFKSPFYDESSVKYITFEPDHGGWNNIRMAMETVLVMAHAMGRTLVLPPEKGMYLLGKKGSKEEKHKTDFSFQDFFHLDSIAVEHEGIDIITMEEYLERMALKGKLADRSTGKVMQPPEGRVNWNGQPLHTLWNYLEEVSYLPEWSPTTCVAAIPSKPGPEAVDELQRIKVDLLKEKLPDPEEDYIGKPTAVDAPAVDRLRELMAERTDVCIYDTEMQNEPTMHFKVSKTTRLLSHFYAFVFFQDWRQDLWSKRFVRDHVRYIDEIVCAAARIVAAVRTKASHNSPTQSTDYDSFHVRRGDFQYKKTRLDAPALYENSKDELTEGTTLYIATDERDKSFFDPLREHYNLMFLDDYMHLIEGVNPNYYGMLDQLVAYRGRIFFGTWFSTLSGYVNRMRGYASVKQKWEGYEGGDLPESFYFTPEDKKYQMIQYKPVKKPIYMREFPVSWRDIDRGIGELD